MDKAIRVYRRLNAHADRTLSEPDPVLLECRTDLGRGYLHAGRLGEAARLFQQVLALAPDDPGALAGLGAVRVEQGRGEEALALAEKAWTALGDGQASPTMIVRIDAHRAADDLDRALELAHEAVARHVADKGETHPDTWNTRAALARVLLARAEGEQALRSLAPIWTAWQADHRLRCHPDALSCGNDLAEIYLALGRAVEADALLRRVLSLAGRRFSVGHPATVRARSNLSRISLQ